MKKSLRCLVVLPLVFALLSCGSISAALGSPTPTNTALPPSPTSTDTPAPTATATVTLTATPLPPTQTPTASSTPEPSATPIPLDVQVSIFEDVWSVVNTTYVYPNFNGLDWKAIHAEYGKQVRSGLTNEQFYQAMSSMIERLGDNHSFFLDPRLVAEQEATFAGEHDYVGIGVMAGAIPARNRAVILAVFPGSPAEAAGLKPRDSLLSVDGRPILDEYGYLRDIVRGPEGSSLTLTVQSPGGSSRQVQLTRQRVTGDYPLFYQVLDNTAGKRIGYIFLATFEDGTVDEQVANAIDQMSAQAPLDGLILDNRMNNGGSSLVLDPVLSYFASGDLGYYVSRDEQRPLNVKLHDIHGSSTFPLVVLVGPGTASFGEIFSGILQDIGRAYVIGTTTDGNVEILWGYDMEDGSQLWLANETFRPLKHPSADWEQTGIVPDLNVAGDFDEYSLASDPAVLAAVDYLTAR